MHSTPIHLIPLFGFFKRFIPIIMVPFFFLARFTSLGIQSLLSFLCIWILGRMSTIPWTCRLILLNLVYPVIYSIMPTLLFSMKIGSKEMEDCEGLLVIRFDIETNIQKSK